MSQKQKTQPKLGFFLHPNHNDSIANKLIFCCPAR